MKKFIFGMLIMLGILLTIGLSLQSNNSNNCPIPSTETFAPPTKTSMPPTDLPPSSTPQCTPTPENTSMPIPKLFPSPTVPELFFTPTNIPEGTATVIIPSFTADPPDPQNHKTKTPTPIVVLVYQTPMPECNNNCLCLLVTQAVIANDLERTQIAVDLQQNSCPILKK